MGRINVQLDPSLQEQLEAAAHAEGVSPSDLVRTELREHLESKGSHPSCLDLARKAGIVGVYTDAPSDLSTNDAHFEGFGGR